MLKRRFNSLSHVETNFKSWSQQLKRRFNSWCPLLKRRFHSWSPLLKRKFNSGGQLLKRKFNSWSQLLKRKFNSLSHVKRVVHFFWVMWTRKLNSLSQREKRHYQSGNPTSVCHQSTTRLWATTTQLLAKTKESAITNESMN